MNIFEELKLFYREVDARAARLSEIHAERLNCQRGCSACCIDGITVFEIEAENIRKNYAELLENETPRRSGACAFLDGEKACRIYPDRPYVCRTQGLPLRWLEEFNDEIIELRDICPLNEAGEPVEELPADLCWTIGEFEARLAGLQDKFSEGDLNRIALRSLF